MDTRSTDADGRVSLPSGFANATVIIEQISDTEIRIRKAVGSPPEDAVRFAEECLSPLSDADRDLFLNLLDAPPAPVAALERAVRERAGHRG